jgi:hypothetical protein
MKQAMVDLSHLALTFLSLERVPKGVRNPMPVRTNRDRYDSYLEQLRKRGLLANQQPLQYDEYVVRFPKGSGLT